MPSRQILVAVGLDKEQTLQIPTVLVKSEEELQNISSELGRILEGNVYRLVNGLVIITDSGSDTGIQKGSK